MSTLHTVNKSPFTHTTLASCLAVCDETDDILLLEDGVFGAIDTAPSTERLQSLMESGVTIYALEGDIKARGLTNKILSGIVITDYAEFVRLSITHRCIQSWY